MEIEYFQDHKALDQKGSTMIIEMLRKNAELKLCAATGNSPTGIYKKLADHSMTAPQLYSRLQIIKLDEWVGLEKEDPGTCEKYLQDHLVKPLGISEDRFLSFDPNPIDPETECQRVQTKFNEISPIDVCVLGLGKNGHIGFNEPGRFEAHCHVRQLETDSMDHSMIAHSSFKPTLGLTLGVEDILSAKKIILIVSGTGKGRAIQDLLTGDVSSDCPASILWKHSDVSCLIFQEQVLD